MQANDKSQREFLKNLYMQQSENMFRYAYSVLRDSFLAEEAVQETFVVAWDKIEQLINMESPVGWLFGVLKITMKRIKTNEYKLRKTFVTNDETIADSITAHDDLESSVLLEDMFSNDDYSILKKIYLHGFTYNELAEELDLPLSTVSMRIKRAKEKFKKSIEE